MLQPGPAVKHQPATTTLPSQHASLHPPLAPAIHVAPTLNIVSAQLNVDSAAHHQLNVSTPTSITSDLVLGDAVVPHDVASAALQGTSVDLSKFLIKPHIVTEQNTFALKNGKLPVNRKMAGRPIHTYQVWLSAWANYEELLVRYLPASLDIYRRCNEYRRFIHACQEKYLWSAVYNYDMKICTLLAESHSVAFDSINMKCYALALTLSSSAKMFLGATGVNQLITESRNVPSLEGPVGREREG
jgi:hypothetical protein